MSIICGIDFSESSWRAAAVAAALAHRRGVPLLLVHTMGEWADVFPDEYASSVRAIEDALKKGAAKAGLTHEDLRPRAMSGAPERALLKIAQDEHAELVVFGATGKGSPRGAAVGRTADRLSQQSHVPALVVRDADRFERWLRNERPLRIFVGLDFNLVSDEAWRWARHLSTFGPVALHGAHLYWPPQEFARLGLAGLRSYVEADPEVDRVLRRELAERFTAEGAPVELATEPSLGRRAERLAQLASEAEADLVVVGSHQRSAIARLWEGSVSRGVLHAGARNVACIPLRAEAGEHPALAVKTVLTATDFSPVGDAAVEHAFAAAPRGGKVYLAHVLRPSREKSQLAPRDIFEVSPEHAKATAEALEQLRARIPTDEDARGVSCELLTLEAEDAGDALAQAAERLGVDLICLGTHGHTGLKKTVLGSVAQKVLACTERPTLLVRKPRE